MRYLYFVWKELEQALPYARVRLDCGTASESIDRLLEEKMYPIVKVRRKSGAVHWIMLTGTEKDTHDITAMDPIDGFVHMSDYKLDEEKNTVTFYDESENYSVKELMKV